MKALVNETKRMQKLAGIINESQLSEDEKSLDKFGATLFDRLKKNGYNPKYTKNDQEYENLKKVAIKNADQKLAVVYDFKEANTILIGVNEKNMDDIDKIVTAMKSELPDGAAHKAQSSADYQISIK